MIIMCYDTMTNIVLLVEVKVGSQIILQEQKDSVRRLQSLLSLPSQDAEGYQSEVNKAMHNIYRTMVSWLDIASDVLANAETAVTVLDDLLNYDKIEMGTMRMEFNRIKICQFISDVRKHFRLSAAKKKIEMTLEYVGFEALQSEDVFEVRDTVNALSAGSYDEEDSSLQSLVVFGDISRLAQVIRNLISNALKFTAEKGQVHISCKSPLLLLLF